MKIFLFATLAAVLAITSAIAAPGITQLRNASQLPSHKVLLTTTATMPARRMTAVHASASENPPAARATATAKQVTVTLATATTSNQHLSPYLSLVGR